MTTELAGRFVTFTDVPWQNVVLNAAWILMALGLVMWISWAWREHRREPPRSHTPGAAGPPGGSSR